MAKLKSGLLQKRAVKMQPVRALAITPTIRREIVSIIDDRIKDVHVTKEDFSELKAIVKDLAVAQKRTEIKVEELAEAQKRTEARVEELTVAQKELVEAQKRTEARVEELAVAQKDLAEAQRQTSLEVRALVEAQKQTSLEVKNNALGLKDNRRQLGGLAQSVAYAFENEAYRFLPKLLEERYGLQIDKKMIRAEINDEEINLFCRAQRNGREVFIVGESKLRLEDKQTQEEAFEQLERKIVAVKTEYGDVEIVPMFVTHFSKKSFLEQAEARGIIIVQSFEW